MRSLLWIAEVQRKEYNILVATVHISENAVIDNLVLDNITSENHTGEPMPMFVNDGVVNRLVATNIRADGNDVENLLCPKKSRI